MRSVTSYRLVNGEVVKTHASATPVRESYDAEMEVPFHQRVINAYYQLECAGKPLGIKNKTFVANVHRSALAEGL